MSIGRRRATYADLEAVPPEKVAELIDGELIVSPRPAGPHSKAESLILADISGEFGNEPGWRGRIGGWWILVEPELHFGQDVLVPDVAGWRRHRWPEVPDTKFFTDPPDWVCEVASHSTARIDRERKMPKYAAAGVQHAWLVEPRARRIEIFRLEEGVWSLARSCENPSLARLEPFAESELEVGRWWLSG